MKTAIVTGASSGIGYELTRILCKKGYRVLGIGRNINILEELKVKLKNSFDYLSVDLIKRESIDEIVKYVDINFRHVDILINNAGYGICKRLIEHDIEDIENIFLVNAIRPLQLINALLKYMDRGSTIVNIITLAIYTLSITLPSYGAAKIALHYASVLLEKELKKRGINVLRVYPGPVRTKFFERAGKEMPKRFLLEPNEVAKAIVKAIEKKKSKIVIPWYLGILPIISNCPLPINY